MADRSIRATWSYLCWYNTLLLDLVVSLFRCLYILQGPACKDPDAFPDPMTFRLDRPVDRYIHFGFGPHECLGREIALLQVTYLIKVVAGLKNLRPAPGDMGALKSIQIGSERSYLSSDWAELTFDPTTWKLHFDGFGRGVYRSVAADAVIGRDLDAVADALKKQQAEHEGEGEEAPKK